MKGQWYAAWRNTPTEIGNLVSEYRIGVGPMIPSGWLGEIGLTHPQAHAMLTFWRGIDAPAPTPNDDSAVA